MKQNEDYAILQGFFNVFHATKNTRTNLVNTLRKMFDNDLKRKILYVTNLQKRRKMEQNEDFAILQVIF